MILTAIVDNAHHAQRRCPGPIKVIGAQDAQRKGMASKLTGGKQDAEDKDAAKKSDAVLDDEIDNDPPRARKGHRARKKLFRLPVVPNAGGSLICCCI